MHTDAVQTKSYSNRFYQFNHPVVTQNKNGVVKLHFLFCMIVPAVLVNVYNACFMHGADVIECFAHIHLTNKLYTGQPVKLPA